MRSPTCHLDSGFLVCSLQLYSTPALKNHSNMATLSACKTSLQPGNRGRCRTLWWDKLRGNVSPSSPTFPVCTLQPRSVCLLTSWHTYFLYSVRHSHSLTLVLFYSEHWKYSDLLPFRPIPSDPLRAGTHQADIGNVMECLSPESFCCVLLHLHIFLHRPTGGRVVFIWLVCLLVSKISR